MILGIILGERSEQISSLSPSIVPLLFFSNKAIQMTIIKLNTETVTIINLIFVKQNLKKSSGCGFVNNFFFLLFVCYIFEITLLEIICPAKLAFFFYFECGFVIDDNDILKRFLERISSRNSTFFFKC